MEISVLASGSNGNSCFIGDNGISVLIDVGKSCKEIERRLQLCSHSLEEVSAILLTHAHSDHCIGADVISRKYRIPVYMTQETFHEAKHRFLNLHRRIFSKNVPFEVEGLKIIPVPTSHNVDSCGFVINDFGLFTDTGAVTPAMQSIFSKLKAVLLESNHDIDKLIHGPYPSYLKHWILSEQGHLSNIDASNLIQTSGKNLSIALLGHLSGTNNTIELTKKTFETLVKRKIDFQVCSRHEATGTWKI